MVKKDINEKVPARSGNPARTHGKTKNAFLNERIDYKGFEIKREFEKIAGEEFTRFGNLLDSPVIFLCSDENTAVEIFDLKGFAVIVVPEDKQERVIRYMDNHLDYGKSLILSVNDLADLERKISKDGILNALSKLDPVDQDRKIKRASKILGCTNSVLRDGLKKKHGKSSASPGQSIEELFEEIEPFPEEVNAEEVLDELKEVIESHAYLPSYGSTALALWIVFTYFAENAEICPYLGITSPEKRCGKTTVLSIVEDLVYRPLSSSNISPASIYRAIEKVHPTLIIDEADTFLNNLELVGILNAGHRKGKDKIIRTDMDRGGEVKAFSALGPKAIAKIGEFPSTLADRCIQIPLDRKPPYEKIKRLTIRFREQQEERRRKIKRFADDNIEAFRKKVDDLAENDELLPNIGNDRARDNWTPLIAIADIAGGKWPELAREAMVHLEARVDKESIGAKLLKDIMSIFNRRNAERLASSEITRELNKMEGRPWPEWNRGREMSPNSLARVLKRYKIEPKQMKINGCNVRGYMKSDIERAYEIYANDLPDPRCYTATFDKNNNNFNELGVEVEEEGSTIKRYSEGDEGFIDGDDDAPPF